MYLMQEINKMSRRRKNSELNFEIGLRCQTARRDMGYTQQQLAEIINVSVQYLSDMERGKVGMSIPTVIKICKALGVSTDFILLGKENDLSNISSEMKDVLILQKQLDYLPTRERKLILRIVKVLYKFFRSSGSNY